MKLFPIVLVMSVLMLAALPAAASTGTPLPIATPVPAPAMAPSGATPEVAPPPAAPVALPVPPRPAPLRVAVYVVAEDYSNYQPRYNSGWPPQYIHYRIDFDRPMLLSFVRGRLAGIAGIQVVESTMADLVLRVDLRGDMDSVRGTYTLLDGRGVVLGEESSKAGMPIAFDPDMSGPAMKRAREVMERLLPGIVIRVSSQMSNPVSTP